MKLRHVQTKSQSVFTLCCALAVQMSSSSLTIAAEQSKVSKPRNPNPKSINQIVKAPIAYAYIDLATNSSDLPGGNLIEAASKGGKSGGLFGALGGLARGAVGSSDRGNTFGNTKAMGFASGRFMDVSVNTVKNNALAEASQTLPSGMNLGESLKLVAPIPEKPVASAPTDDGPVEPSYEKPKGKISLYWGCGETIRAGQPRTIDVANASLDDYAKFFVARGKTSKGARSQPGSPAWPNKDDDRKVPETASLVGQHSFVGNGIPDSFKLNLAAAQDLMPAIELSQAKIEGSVRLEWKSIAQARGYFIGVLGGQASAGQTNQTNGAEGAELVIWTSSELVDFGFGLTDYQPNADVDKWVHEKVILPPNVTKCEVPKGIFDERGGGILRMIAYGAETVFVHPPRPADPKVTWEQEWQAKVRLKSTTTSILGGLGEAGSRKKEKEEKKNKPADLLKGLFGG
jgi:hypothetical protein